MRYFRVSDVNHVVIDIEVQLKKRNNFCGYFNIFYIYLLFQKLK